MTDISAWSKTASANNSASPDGFPESMPPSGVNDSAREAMASIREFYEAIEWRDWGHTYTYGSATTFTTSSGDADTTAIYLVGRRIRAVGSGTGTIYGRISASSHSGSTTVTCVWDSGSLSNEALTFSVAPDVTGRPDGDGGWQTYIPMTAFASDTEIELDALTGADWRFEIYDMVPSADANLRLDMATVSTYLLRSFAWIQEDGAALAAAYMDLTGTVESSLTITYGGVSGFVEILGAANSSVRTSIVSDLVYENSAGNFVRDHKMGKDATGAATMAKMKIYPSTGNLGTAGFYHVLKRIVV